MRVWRQLVLFTLCFAAPTTTPASAAPPSPEIRIGSKQFTESVILGEIAAGLATRAGGRGEHRRELGGTRILWDALVRGEIDAYPEYTGTLSQEIFARRGIPDQVALRRALAGYGVSATGSLGFSNNYALGMKRETCDRLSIHAISDLRSHPDLTFGFSNEFMDRADGWHGLRSRYGLPQRKVFGLHHDLAYRGVASGQIAVTDLYTTDAEIGYYGLCTLADDLHYFPDYTAIVLYRRDLESRAPRVAAALQRLAGAIDTSEMIRMNRLVKIEKVPESRVAEDFLSERYGRGAGMRVEGTAEQIYRRTGEHLFLVALSLCAAILIGVPLGVISAKWPLPGQLVLGVTGVIQTIPSLALLVFMIPLLGIGGPPVIVALVLYSLLPIVRNTYAGLSHIPPESRESAEAMGLPPGSRLRLIELPLASREILSGIKTSAVINVGTATLGALIGAGGYGQPILTGIRLDDVGLILQGAVPAALLALLVQGAFELIERLLVPRGLRLKPPP